MRQQDVQQPMEGVGGDQGQPEPKASEELPEGQVSSRPQAPVPKQDLVFDLAAEYVVNPATGEKMLGKDIIEGYKRGRGVDKLQSQLHTLQSESEKKDQLIAQYEADRARQEQDKAIFAQLEKAGLIKASPQPQEPDFWDDEGNKTPQLDPESVTRTVRTTAEDITRRYIGKLYGVDPSQINLDNVKSIPDQIRELQSENDAERERQEARQTFGRNLSAAYTKMLKDRYGLGDEEARAGVTRVMVSMGLNAEADRLAGSWDKESQDAVLDNTKQAADQLFDLVDELATAKAEKERREREAELEQQLESGQFPGLTKTEADDLMEGLNPNLPKDRKKWRERVVKAEADKQDKLDAARRSLGR